MKTFRKVSLAPTAAAAAAAAAAVSGREGRRKCGGRKTAKIQKSRRVTSEILHFPALGRAAGKVRRKTGEYNETKQPRQRAACLKCGAAFV